jgi:uncharacterized membrane protein
MSCYWNPENRHKYEKIDHTRKPGEPGKVMQCVLLLISTLIGVPLFFAAIYFLWQLVVPLTLLAFSIMAYKHWRSA